MRTENVLRHAMYEIGESPKYCRKCGGDSNRVIAKWTAEGTTRRKRLCSCGREFVTQSMNPAINAIERINCEAKT